MDKAFYLTVLIGAISSLTAGQKENCDIDGIPFAFNAEDCGTFFVCVNQRALLMPCPEGLVFSLSQKRCVFKDSLFGTECAAFIAERSFAASVDEQIEEFEAGLDDLINDKIKPGVDKLGEIEEEEEEDEEEEDDEMEVDNNIALEMRCMDADAERVAHEGYCHRYFDCSSPHTDDVNRYLTPYEYECPYPQLFSEATMQCEDYDQVDCGERKVYKNPCDYSSNMCSGPNCRPCMAVHPSCEGQKDGIMYWPGREGTGYWVNCTDERTMGTGSCGADEKGRMMIFSEKLMKCVVYSDTLEESCKFSDGRLPHEGDCHRYYDCTQLDVIMQQAKDLQQGEEEIKRSFVKTCPYPQLYSVPTGNCEDYSIVQCGTRMEAKAPCDYMLTPCSDMSYGSCVGMPDGYNVYKTREGSPWYVRCKDERTVEKKMCEQDGEGLFKQFAPGLGLCVSVKEKAQPAS